MYPVEVLRDNLYNLGISVILLVSSESHEYLLHSFYHPTGSVPELLETLREYLYLSEFTDDLTRLDGEPAFFYGSDLLICGTYWVSYGYYV